MFMADAAAVRCEGLRKRYGRRAALHALDLVARRGEVFGLIGANGGGKTTVLRLIAGLLEPDGGTCAVLGARPKSVRHRVGYMGQALGLHGDLTVMENLRSRAALFDLRHPETAARVAIDRAGLAEHASARVSGLSGGWARRVQLAATLVHAPELVLLDEPTVGMDAQARQQVWASILALADAGATVVVATHDLLEAERCARLAFLAEGRVIAAGSPDEVISTAAVQAFILRGEGARRHAATLAACPGVVAAVPRGDALRVVLARGADIALAEMAGHRGLRMSPAAATLEDASHVLLTPTAVAT